MQAMHKITNLGFFIAYITFVVSQDKAIVLAAII